MEALVGFFLKFLVYGDDFNNVAERAEIKSKHGAFDILRRSWNKLCTVHQD
jgi:hypothetical protein